MLFRPVDHPKASETRQMPVRYSGEAQTTYLLCSGQSETMTGMDAVAVAYYGHAMTDIDGSSAGGRVLVVPPAGWGSVGDAAMTLGALTGFKAAGFPAVDLALSRPEDHTLASYDNYIAGNDWYYKGDAEIHAHLQKQFPNYSMACLIGADCIDGSYFPQSIIRRLELVGDIIAQGGRGWVMSASFKAQADKRCVDALRRFPGEIAIRDPVSRQRLENAIGRSVIQSADIAFLCPGDPLHGLAWPMLEWISQQRKQGRRIVAVNINASLARTIEDFSSAHSPIFTKLIEEGASLVLVANDARNADNDEYFLRQASHDLCEVAGKYVRVLPAGHPSATKAVLGAVDLLITSRMHAAILAASSGRPAFCFVYQQKFEGLYDLFGLDSEALLFAPDDLIAKSQAMLERVRTALFRTDDHAKCIEQSLPSVLSLARQNFCGLSFG